MLSAHWLLQWSLFRCHWWWYLGSHVLQLIFSLQLDLTRCPMTVQLRCVLLSLSGKWRGSTISSWYILGTWFRRVRSSRFRYGWMWTHVHQVVLGVDPPSVGESSWRFCICIWYIPTWFSLKHFLIRWSSTPVEACFSHILWPHVSCLDVLSPTEVVRLDVLLSIVLDVLHCNQGLDASVNLLL